MPEELKDFPWDDIKPSGMSELTLSSEYNLITTAVKTGMIPSEFRMLPYDEQAELMAYWYVNSRIQSFYAEEQRVEAVRKQKEMEAKAKPKGRL